MLVNPCLNDGITVIMGPRGKILASILLIIIVIIAHRRFTSRALIQSVETKHVLSAQYPNRGSWVLLETADQGK